MWTSPAGDRGTTINRVRLRGATGLDALAARLRAGRAIEQAAGDVALPAGAILCIRQLRDPRPGRVSLSTLQAPPTEWSQAVAGALADLARRAARPATGPVAADAEAVMFDDRAQLLACLAADWCRGSIAAYWWWRALIGTASEAEAVLRAFRHHPAHIAAAIEEAARIGCATAFVRRLPPRDTALLLEAIVAVHGLSRELTASEPAPRRIPDPPPHHPRTIDSSAAAVPPLRDAAAVWRQSAPEAAAAAAPLRVDQQLLLGVALTVRRNPARARDPMFAAEVAEWRQAVNGVAAVAARELRAGRAAAGPPPGAAAEAAAAQPAALDEITTDPIEAEVADALASAPVPIATDERVPARDTQLPSAASTEAHPTPALPRDDAPSAERDDELQHDRAVPVSPTAAACVDTNLGGLFYLLNVALALELYGDFTAPRGPRLDLSIWRFIALVGDRLLGGRHRRDPLWSLLRDLAGPDPRAFTSITEWRLHPAWLSAFPEPRIWRWSADRGRLRVRHPAGFTVLDVPRVDGQSAAQQVADAIERYRPVSTFRLVRSPKTRARSETDLARWTRWHGTYVRARVARALGVPAPRVGAVLCRHRARVHVSLTHVDVAFSLADLPIAIRLSGLDRNPGWIPAADRIVSFRYD
jgi:hypothetical protein